MMDDPFLHTMACRRAASSQRPEALKLKNNKFGLYHFGLFSNFYSTPSISFRFLKALLWHGRTTPERLILIFRQFPL
jgi:hypothetical protein